MCGRYIVDEQTVNDMIRLAEDLGFPFENKLERDILPSQNGWVLTAGEGEKVRIQTMAWGLPSHGKLLINARSETCETKPRFATIISRWRCIIPASGFYEWDKAKTRVTFTRADHKTIYMAGFYQDGRYIIITRPANAFMEPVHDRMPLILEEEDALRWIFDRSYVTETLKTEPPALTKSQPYEQTTLW